MKGPHATVAAFPVPRLQDADPEASLLRLTLLSQGDISESDLLAQSVCSWNDRILAEMNAYDNRGSMCPRNVNMDLPDRTASQRSISQYESLP